MPQNITDVPGWTAPLVVPANGDAVDGDGWLVHGQGVGNRTSYLREGVPGRASSYVLRFLPPVAGFNESDRFQYQIAGVSGGMPAWNQIDVTDAGGIEIDLTNNLPTVGEITKITAVVMFTGGEGSGQHAAAMPGTKPTLTYHEDSLIDLSEGGFFASPTVTDPTVTLTPYLNLHRIDLTSFHANHDLTLSSFRTRKIRFTGETGANSTAGMGLLAIEVTIVPE